MSDDIDKKTVDFTLTFDGWAPKGPYYLEWAFFGTEEEAKVLRERLASGEFEVTASVRENRTL